MTSKQLTLKCFFTTNDEVEESHPKQTKWSRQTSQGSESENVTDKFE